MRDVRVALCKAGSQIFLKGSLQTIFFCLGDFHKFFGVLELN